ncbi:VOC family protein, partial [bacterium]|nr:VOC family protein [bacterium]
MKRYEEMLPKGIFRRLDHVGIAVKNLEAARADYVDRLGFVEAERESLPEQGVEVIMLDGGNCRVELLAPLGDNSPIAKFLEKRGEGMQQAAFQVADLDAALAELANRGVKPIAPPSVGAGGLR